MYQALRENPLDAKLTVKIVITSPDPGKKGITVETWPPSNPASNVWDIDGLFQRTGIAREPGTYLFEQSTSGGFKMVEAPMHMGSQDCHKLELAFARVMAVQHAVLMDLFARFPSDEALDDLAKLIGRALSQQTIIRTVFGERDLTTEVRVTGDCPHCKTIREMERGGANVERLILAGITGLATLAASANNTIHWNVEREGPARWNVQVALSGHGDVFDGLVNNALASELEPRVREQYGKSVQQAYETVRKGADQLLDPLKRVAERFMKK